MSSRGAGGKISQKGQWFLWPDDEGLINLPQQSRAPSSGSQLLRSRRLPRVARATGSLWPHSQSLLSLRLWRLSGGRSLYMVSRSRFSTWLLIELQAADFEAITLAAVIEGAGQALDISPETARRYLIQVTGSDGMFMSDGVIVTIKGDE